MKAFKPTFNTCPSTVTVVAWFPWDEATIFVFPVLDSGAVVLTETRTTSVAGLVFVAGSKFNVHHGSTLITHTVSCPAGPIGPT
jgi:hypothetical protein